MGCAFCSLRVANMFGILQYAPFTNGSRSRSYSFTALWVLPDGRDKHILVEYPRLQCGCLGCHLHQLQHKYRTFTGSESRIV